MKEIKLTQGKVVLIDDEDYELVSKYKWCAIKSYCGIFYAIANIYKNKKRTTLFMHRLIMGINDRKLDIHHADEDGLNNQKNNLKVMTRSQHHMTKNKRKNCSSKFKGVTWYKQDKKWQAEIQVNGHKKYLGRFDSEEEAAKTYNIVAQKYFDEFVKLNFIDD